jgi:hypothetical protein
MSNSIQSYNIRPIDTNILSILDVADAGKVVTAESWTTLWTLVISHVNELSGFCEAVEPLLEDWENAKEELNSIVGNFNKKYDAFAEGFTHYGKDAPTNEHTRFWVQPISDLSTFNLVNKYDLYSAMSATVKTLRTAEGTLVSQNADFAEVAEWADGNPNNEDRTGYFVCSANNVDGIVMQKAKAGDDVKGVTILNPAFAGNYTKDKLDSSGKLLPKYSYVAIIGFVPVIDNGRCIVGGRCMPDNDGCAVPSNNNMGYQIVKRIDAKRVLIIVEPNGDMVQRVKRDVLITQSEVSKLTNNLAVFGNDLAVFGNRINSFTGRNIGKNCTAGSSEIFNDYVNNVAGYLAHARNNKTKALANFSSAEGSNTTVEEGATNGHVEGNACIVKGVNGHAQNVQTEAIGNNSHAQGWGCKAIGTESDAGGKHTTAVASSQTVRGQYNSEDYDAYFIVGNGTSDTDRKNAFTSNKDGTATIQTAPKKDMDVANKGYVDNLVGSVETALDSIIAMQEELIGGEA